MANKTMDMSGTRYSTRDGIDTREKGWIGAVSDKTELSNNSVYKPYGMRTIYVDNYTQNQYDQKRRQEEEDQMEKQKQKQIDFQRSIRNTEANFPSLVKGNAVSKAALSYKHIGTPPTTTTPEVVKPVKRVRNDFVPPPFIIRSGKPAKCGMLDERTAEVFVRDEDEGIEEVEARYEEIGEGDTEADRAEWEAFEWNAHLGVSGRQFDV